MMNLMNGIILNLIYLLFPLTIYTICISYLTSFNKEEKNIYLDFALFSSFILMLKFGADDYLISFFLFISTPLLISYVKSRKLTAIIISIILVFYSTKLLKFNIFYAILEYFSYFIIYVIYEYKNYNRRAFMDIFIAIKSFILGFELFYILLPEAKILTNMVYLLFLILIFILGTYLILLLIRKGDSLIELNSIMQKLNKEKALKLSLFKLTHEIKNPMSVCKGYLEMFDYDDIKNSSKYIPIIKDEIDRTLNIINDFSDYGKIKIKKDISDITMLLEDIRDTYKYLLDSDSYKLNVFIPDDDVYINMDYDRIKQVFVNLIKNSIEARIDNSKLIIDINLIVNKNNIKIVVSDNGIGMSNDTLEKMLGIFYTTKKNGTGIGVALSREIIELHDGSINYKSKEGMGTVVTIKLPK